MSLIGSLMSAVSGLHAAQAALQITSNNIANVNTEGYSRKTAALQTVAIEGQTAGVRLSDVQRTVDENLLRQIRDHLARLGGLSARHQFLSRTETLFGTLADNASLSHVVTELGAAFEAFATTPESAAGRAAAVEAARHLSGRLNHMTSELQLMRLEADQEIARTAEQVNSVLAEIHDLNQRISRGLATGQPVGDLQDRRDVLLSDLAEQIDIQYFERPSGEMVIATGAGRTLLDGSPVSLSHTAAAQITAEATYGNGISGVLYGSGTDITTEIAGGRLKGLIDTRDRNLVDLQAEIDRLAEVLRDQINALHNNGTAFPPPATLTGSRSVAATDAPPMSGSFRVAIVDAGGVVVETLDIDLGALAPPNVGELVAQIDAMANASATIDAAGHVVISASGGNRIAVNELDGAVSTGTQTRGLAHFLGLNNLLGTSDGYDRYVSGRVASDTAALGLSGTLGFQIGGATTNVAYAAGDSLTDIAAAITAALGGDNITASVTREGDGFRLQIIDADGDNIFITDSGTLASDLNLRAGRPGTAARLEVRSQVLQNPNLIAHGQLSDAAGLAAGDIAVAAGDNTIARRLAAVFSADHTFAAAGALPGKQASLAGYAADILAGNALTAGRVANDLDLGKSTQLALETQAAAISQVNLDEELANIVVLQNLYAASARVTTVVSEMLDTLLEMTA